MGLDSQKGEKNKQLKEIGEKSIKYQKAIPMKIDKLNNIY